jgi:hypothetical protein
LQRIRENLHKKNDGQRQKKLGHSEFCGALRVGSFHLNGEVAGR